MSVLGHHALLGLSAAALGGAALRAASLAAPSGLERVLAAAPLAVAAAVLEALLLGFVALGGSTLALAAAAGATWLACRAALPAPRQGLAGELGAWWRRLSTAERVLCGALLGVTAAWTAWLLRHPALGYDSLLYHVSEAVTWVQDGRPGSVEQIVNGLPVGSYPVTHEVLIAWALGIARSFVPASLLVPAVAALTAAAGWHCLRALGVARAASGLAVAALVAAPPALAYGRSGASLDPAALAWLATAAALAASSRRRPALMAPMLVAAGLAAGTKTTALPLAIVIAGLGLYAGRRELRRLGRPIVVAAVAALAVSATWYLRNLVQHGSPFWPFLPLPWGDPAPVAVKAADISFLDRPGETVSRLREFYLEQSAGLLLLLAGALAAPLVVRRREVLAAAVATALSLLLWLNAPLTGVSDNPGFDPGTADAVRYLLPGLGAAVLTLALAARASRAGHLLALPVLALALAVNLFQAFDLGFPAAPSPLTPLAGAVAGAALGLIAATARLPRLPRLPVRGAGAALAAAAAGCLLAPAATGYTQRHADAGLWDAGLVGWFSAREDDERPVAMTGAVHALLSGDRLQRRAELIPARESCAAVSGRRLEGWVVFTQVLRQRGRRDVRDCFAGERPAFGDESFRIFAPSPEPGA